MFNRVLIANRGEIAVRIIRTLRSLGIHSIAVYSEADRHARHVLEADTAVYIGPAPALQSYLSVSNIINAAVQTGAQAIHPGYGFLSENPELATAASEHGIVFVGPPIAAIHAMGDKIRSKELVAGFGVPVVPGLNITGLRENDLVKQVAQIGYPVLIKPSAGGGGKGMHVVHSKNQLLPEIAMARREALNAFGDDTLLIEKFITAPRHIEIQILADQHGNVLHLGERECSLQRRHQKVIEEAPSAVLDPIMRERMGAAAIAVARSCSYTNAGTVEFIVSSDSPNEFFFLEMNTRLQVEHPVTEMVYGLDLVELQLRIAAGEPLPFKQQELEPNGHAIEARIYAEDPATGFLPTGGLVLRSIEPNTPGVRIDSGLANGMLVGLDYDPILAKVIAYGHDRSTAISRLDHALGEIAVLGVRTNVSFLRNLLRDQNVIDGRLDTDLIGRLQDQLAVNPNHDEAVVTATICLIENLNSSAPVSPWDDITAWRCGTHDLIEMSLLVDDVNEVTAVAQWTPAGWTVALNGETPEPIRVINDGNSVTLIRSNISTIFAHAFHEDVLWLSSNGHGWSVKIKDRLDESTRLGRSGGQGLIPSPMPGLVTAIYVSEGDVVVAGQIVVVLEAMKMEYVLRAAIDGVVQTVHVRVGSQVKTNEPVVTVAKSQD